MQWLVRESVSESSALEGKAMTKMLKSALLGVILWPWAILGQVVILSNTNIGPDNRQYEGSDLVVQGCVVAINGAHTFNSLTLSNNATVGHGQANDPAGALWLTISNTVLVDASSRIDVNGCGYAPGDTPWHTTNYASKGGGSYGGLGDGAANPTYGNFRDPREMGAGSSRYAYGGGLIRLSAKRLVLDGLMTANGGNGDFWNGPDAGAGGGIRLDLGALLGSGTIMAHGGEGSCADFQCNNKGKPGGGGRIAVYCLAQDLSAWRQRITAYGGQGGLEKKGFAGAGTVYLETSLGKLLFVANYDNGQSNYILPTPLGVQEDASAGYADFADVDLSIANSNTLVFAYNDIPIVVSNLALLNGAVLTTTWQTNREAGLRITASGTVLVDAASRIDGSGRGYAPGDTPWHTTNYASKGGGSYGGLGDGAANPTYGNFRDPREMGAGSSRYAYGGGLIRLSAKRLVLDGLMTANGGNGDFWNGPDAGAGGGIRLDLGALLGSGTIMAHGGEGSCADFQCNNKGKPGGGGRIAVYCLAQDLSAWRHRITAYGGQGGREKQGFAGAGTVYLETSLGKRLSVANCDNGQSNYLLATPLGVQEDASAGYADFADVDLIEIANSNTLVTLFRSIPVIVSNLSLCAGAAMTHEGSGEDRALRLVVKGDLLIDAHSKIDVTGQGYVPGDTPWHLPVYASQGGGSYGGRGEGQANPTYGAAQNPNELGSGGAYYPGPNADILSNGAGGGLIRIVANRVLLEGGLRADGRCSVGIPGGKAGSGGGIALSCGTLVGSGWITANGGSSSYSGGGGRIAIYAFGSAAGFDVSNHVAANAGGGGATDGSVYLGQQPYFAWDRPTASPIHGTVPLRWTVLGLPVWDFSADLFAYDQGLGRTLATGHNPAANFAWNTATVPDSRYDVRVRFRNTATSAAAGEAGRILAVVNHATWHTSAVSGAETWASGTVHIVDDDIAILTNGLLTIAAGTVIKFTQGSSIVVNNGGTLHANGTSNAPIILTSIADDSAGGDVNKDGGATIPRPGDWDGIQVLDGGTANLGNFTELRYYQQGHIGTFGADEVWSGNVLHFVSGDCTVPSGGALTIQAGAIVKMRLASLINVAAGARLNVDGTLAQPVVITSERDDTYGGDSNWDGDLSTPAAGDWRKIAVAGALNIRHALIRYGGGGGSGGYQNGDGAISPQPGGVATIANAIIEEPFYEGISCQAGGAAYATNMLILNADRAVNADAGVITLVNCTLDNNRVGLWPHGGTINAANCIISRSLETGVSAGANNLRYCNVWSATGSNGSFTPGTNGNISADPKFKAVDRQEYRLNYRSPCIDAADTTVAPANDYMGAPRYSDPRTPLKTGLPNTNGVYADMGAFEFVENAESPIDLVLSAIDGPTAATVGEPVSLAWTVKNIGTAPAAGPWHDAVSLTASSPDGTNYIAAGSFLGGQGAVLPPGSTITITNTIRVPIAPNGSYQWSVLCNSHDDVFEGANRSNNQRNADSWLLISAPLIEPNSITSAILPHGGALLYAMTCGAQQSFSLNISSADQAHFRILIGMDYIPSATQHDLSASNAGSTNAMLDVTLIPGHTYYLVIASDESGAGSRELTIRADETWFHIGRVAPNMIGRGQVTLDVSGVGLSPGTEWSLIDQTTRATNAVAVFSQSLNRQAVTFNTTDLAAGPCRLCAVLPGMTSSVENAVTLVDSLPQAPLFMNLQLPNVVRVGREFECVFSCRNTGWADAPAQLVHISSPTPGVQFRASPSGPWESALWIWTSGSSMAPGRLAPNEERNVRFMAKTAGGGATEYVVSYFTENNTAAMRWPDLEADAMPAGVDMRKWAATWSHFTNVAGHTVGGYVRHLNTMAGLAAHRGSVPNDFYSAFSSALIESYFSAFANATGSVAGADMSALIGRTIFVEGANPTNVGFATVDYDGSFRFFDLAPDAYAVRGPEVVAPTGTQFRVLANTTTHVTGLVVAAGATISGTVRDETGAPAPNVLVFFKNESDLGKVAETAANGRYCVPGFDTSNYMGYCLGASLISSSVVMTITSATQELTQDFIVFHSGEIDVNIVNSDPYLTNVMAALDGVDGMGGMLIQSNRAINFVNIPEGNYHAVIAADHYLTTTITVASVANARSPYAVNLKRAATMRARFVSDTSAMALTGVRCLLSVGTSVMATAVSADDGYVVFSGLDAGAGTLSASYGWMPASNYSVMAMAGVTADYVFAMSEGRVIAGQARDDVAGPVEGISIVAANTTSVSQIALTDDQGRFEFRGCLLDTYSIAPGGIYVAQTVPTTSETSYVHVVIAGARLRIDLQDYSAGSFAPTAYLFTSNRYVARAPISSNGVALFYGISQGNYEIIAPAESHGWRGSMDVTGGVVHAEIPAYPCATLHGLVQGAAGSAGDQFIEFKNADFLQDDRSLFIDTAMIMDGQYVSPPLIPGNYHLYWHGLGTAHLGDVLVNSQKVFNLSAPAFLTIAGQVTGLHNHEQMVVRAYADGELDYRAASACDRDGYYVVEVMATGRITLAVQQGFTTLAITSAIMPAAPPVIHLTDPLNFGCIEGAVLNDRGNRLPNCGVLLLSDSGHLLGSQTADGRGNYAFTNIPYGIYRVMAHPAGHRATPSSALWVDHGIDQRGIQILCAYVGGMPDYGLYPAEGRSAKRKGYRPDFLPFVPNPGGVLAELWRLLERENPKPLRTDALDTPDWVEANRPPRCNSAKYLLKLMKTFQRELDLSYSLWEKAHADVNRIITENAFVLVGDTGGFVLGIITFPAAAWKDKVQAVRFAKLLPYVPISALGLEFICSQGWEVFQNMKEGWIKGDYGEVVKKAWSLIDNSSTGVSLLKDLKAFQASLKAEGMLAYIGAGSSVIKGWVDFIVAIGNIKEAVEKAKMARKGYEDSINNYKHLLYRYYAFNNFCQGNGIKPPYPRPRPLPGDPDGADTNGNMAAASEDPNDMVGPAGSGIEHWMLNQVPWLYTIHFENVATASAPAQVVMVTNDIDPHLDWSTFEIGSFGLGSSVYAIPAGLMGYRTNVDDRANSGLNVELDCCFDPSSGRALWAFTSLDPRTGLLTEDPIAGFLPPNTNPPCGEGWVSYTIRPRTNLPHAEQIEAMAGIVFDANAALATRTITNAIDAVRPTSSVDALPALAPREFLVSWSGTDGIGSGVAAYDVYVAKDSGEFTLWQEKTAATSAVCAGDVGSTYFFYCVATDNVGNRELAPSAAQAQTTVGVGIPWEMLLLDQEP